MNSIRKSITTTTESFPLKPRLGGPRAEKRNKEYLELAKIKAKLEAEDREKQENEEHVYESTTQDAQKYAKSQITRPSCIDIGHEIAKSTLASNGGEVNFSLLATQDREVCNEDAVTHWSEKLKGGSPDFPLSSVLSSVKPFARSSAFTNDIRDSRLRHSEAAD